jgi:ATP-dependent Clp protease ATP-binding subunit ClpA
LNAAISISGQRLCRLAREAAEAGDGESALRTLGLLRDELEEFERQQAARALAAGRSYSDVARALGISRQAAHRRFRHLATEAPPSDGQLRASDQVRFVVGHASAEARALGATAVEPEHLLLGILRSGEPRAAAALAAAGVTLENARREVAIGHWAPPQPAGTATRNVLARSVRFARRDRAEHVEVEHILRGVLEAMDGSPGNPLARLKVPVRGILDALEADTAEPPVVRVAG